MAEETPLHDDFELTNHDDMSVMRELLHTVKGLSPISVAPVLETVAVDDQSFEQFEFEQ